MSNKNSDKNPKNLFSIGKVLKARGLKGEVKVFLYNRDSDIMNKDISFWLKKGNNFLAYSIESHKKLNKYHIVKFKDIINRLEAEEISDSVLYASRLDLDNKKGYYLIDLIGFLIKDELNTSYGEVIDIINLPSNDSLLINYNNKEILIPIIDDFVELFDYENEIIVIKNSDVFLKGCWKYI